MSKRRNRIEGQFAPRPIGMLESPAYRAMSLSGHRVLSHVEVEHAHHGGKENGRLPVTFDQFVEYGLHRHSIGPGMRETVALGFLVITEKGRAGNAEHRSPNKFRLTYRHAEGISGDGSHEWRSIATIEEAEAIADAARKAKAPKKTKSQCRKVPAFSDKNRHRNVNSPVPKTGTMSAAKTGTTSISRDIQAQSGCEARPFQGAVASSPTTHDRTDIVQDRVAHRLRAHGGWSVMMDLPAAELDRLVELEAAGNLGDEDIHAALLAMRRGAA